MFEGSVGVIGGGAWGLALAATCARAGTPVSIHSRRALSGALPRGVTQARDLAETASARLIVFAVPSTVAREVARTLGDHVDGRHYVVHGVRGLAGDVELTTISEILREETPVRRLGALGGPALPDDLAAGRPSVMVCGSMYPEVNEALRQAFVTEKAASTGAPIVSKHGKSPSLRLYATDDLRGLEWASALVGCLAIGVGYAQAIGLGAGLVAALISRGVQEAGRLASAAGGEERTLLGLAGYGDLLASVEQRERPEVALGAKLARGLSLGDALREVKLRVEAVELMPRVLAWAERQGVSVPIFQTLANGVLTSRKSDEMIRELMTHPMEDRG